jgi:hypothetical protein
LAKHKQFPADADIKNEIMIENNSSVRCVIPEIGVGYASKFSSDE